MSSTKEGPLLLGIAQSLVRANLLDKSKALQYQAQAQTSNQSLIQYLVDNKFLKADNIATFLSKNFCLPLLDIDAVGNDQFPSNLLSEVLIRKHSVLPIFKRGNQLYIAVEDPSREAAIKDIQFYTRLQVNLIIVESDKLRIKIDEFLKQYNDSSLHNIASEKNELAKLEIISENPSTGVLEAGVLGAHDAPIVRFVNKILVEAMGKNTSDIHFEPYETFYRVRYRIDGVLVEVSTPPISLATRITARIKILSNLDISERRVPQDGRFNVKNPQGRTVECRVSTCPTTNGEKVVIRLLDPGQINLNINELGFDDQQKEIFLHAIHKPIGLIIVTGPTGSGKSLTLYNALNILNTKDVNICSVEDPVEIRMLGVNQVNINPKAGLTFSTTLRSFLRQDPNVIMIGEIRDLETAEIAISASQTGHLVLSTLHTNSAIETLTRLKNMGIPSYNIASSLSLMMAQRLVRKLCPDCKVLRDDVAEKSLIELGYTEEEISSLKLYRPEGCYLCTNGYKGRIGLYELLPINKEVEDLIASGGASKEVTEYANKVNMKTIYRSGLDKVKAGITTLEELNRVAIET